MKSKALILFILLSITFSTARAQRFGKDSMACITHLSLYIEDYKLFKEGTGSPESFDNMVKSWFWVFENCPRASENIYIDGVKIIKEVIKKEPKRKEALIDTIMLVYDNRIKYFNKEGYILGRKGVDLYILAPSRYEEVYNILSRSVELYGNKSSSAVLVYYFRVTIKMANENKIQKSVIVDVYDKVSDILDYNIALGNKKTPRYENAQGNIEKSFEPYASCEDLLSIYQAKFDNSKDDPEVLKKIIRILDKKDCEENELYLNAILRLYELEPSPESAFLIGKLFLRKEKYSEAAGYLKQGGGQTNLSHGGNSYLLRAHALMNLGMYPGARTAALKAAALKSDDGRPYMLIGDMYAASASRCGDNKVSSKAAFWAAVDKYYKAKSVDSSLEKEANEKISTYSRYFPPVEDIFFYNLEEGQSYKVECWINETTLVRAVK